jgi:uncharacterized protein
MRWRQGRRSENIEDRRGMSVPGGAVGVGVGGLGLVVIVVIAMLLGIDPTELLQGTDIANGPVVSQSKLSEEQQTKLADFVSLVLGDTESTWTTILSEQNQTYEPPKLVLFTGGVESACGMASAAVGPFYCPQDQKVYLDLDFFYDLQQRFGAPGDFAQAYVVAHEIGHHIQTLEGITQQVEGMRRQASQTEANQLSVLMELQADCYAGVWANRAAQTDLVLDTGDVEEGLNAANAIGDDRLQKQSQGYVVPDAFTHGSSAQRVSWFRRGLDSGDMQQCDTFNAR